MQASTPTYPPLWWQLLQRIALRWTWVSHAQRLYGDDMIGGGMPCGDTVAEANIAGLPPQIHLADGGPLGGGWHRMGLAPHKGAHIVLPHPCGTPQGVEVECLGWW